MRVKQLRGDYGTTADALIGPLRVCDDCGVPVYDESTHDEWHKRMDGLSLILRAETLQDIIDTRDGLTKIIDEEYRNVR